MTQPLDQREIEALAPGWRVQVFDEVRSTNDVARSLGLQGEDACLAVLAEAQTAGRGQRSNRWVTPRGLDIMLSVLLRPTVPVNLWPRLTTLAALASAEAIEDVCPVKALIKWPNDVYIGQRKVCGLLAETVFGKQPFIILGIGLNVNTRDFPPELANLATSLANEVGTPVPRVPVAAALLNRLTERLGQWEAGFEQALMTVRERSMLLGRTIRARVEERIVHGRVRELNHEGHLVLERVDGSTEVLTSAAEVRPDAFL
ncbi:MAG: biotin--[acetyl-CoA-carboxylase] ligase [Verrucomicrobiaceae bacterium]|nr:biotin--[acetyl-CoA-carboxylase] ligase [Verrucomicrobiaceae bacterium]